jgi:hypothetical protein
LKHNIDAYRARFDVKSNKPYRAHGPDRARCWSSSISPRGMGIAGTHITKADDIKAAVPPPSPPASRTQCRDRDRRKALILGPLRGRQLRPP